MYKPLKQLIVSSALGLMTLGCTYSDKTKPASSMTSTPMLNSERIAEKFGSYAVDIIEQNPVYRLSYLFSTNANGESNTRTVAWVQFAQLKHPTLLQTHRRIIAGASIGESLKASGFDIRKEHLHTGELATCEQNATLAATLGATVSQSLAAHTYRLYARLGKKEYLYAQITEIHDPDYLNPAQLKDVVGAYDNETMLSSALEGLADTKAHQGFLECA